MDGDHLVELLERILFDRHNRAIMTGIVHQHIDPAEFFAGGLHDAGAVSFARKVRCEISRSSVGGSDFLRAFRQFGCGAGG